MTSKVRVLVTGAGALLGQGIIRSLRMAPLEVEIIAADPSPLGAGLYWADAARLIPPADAADYVSRVSDVIDRDKPDVVFVGTDVELGLFAAERENLKACFGTEVVVSSPDVVAIADDKYLTYRFLIDNGLPAPASCLPADVEELVHSVGFPLVVKPRVGARSVGVVRVGDHKALEQAIAVTADAVIQELVSGPDHEYTAGVVCDDGDCQALIVMRRDLRDGNTFRAYVDEFPDLGAQMRVIAEKLKPDGPANLQFRSDHGVAKVFEINARFSGTTPLRALAGFNEVEMILRQVLFGEPVVQPPIEPMVILRHMSDTVVRPDDLVVER